MIFSQKIVHCTLSYVLQNSQPVVVTLEQALVENNGEIGYLRNTTEVQVLHFHL